MMTMRSSDCVYRENKRPNLFRFLHKSPYLEPKHVQDCIVQNPPMSASGARLEHDILNPRTGIRCSPPPNIGKVPTILLNFINRRDGDLVGLTPQRKLLNNIDTVEKVVMEELRRIKGLPSVKNAERLKKQSGRTEEQIEILQSNMKQLEEEIAFAGGKWIKMARSQEKKIQISVDIDILANRNEIYFSTTSDVKIPKLLAQGLEKDLPAASGDRRKNPFESYSSNQSQDPLLLNQTSGLFSIGPMNEMGKKGLMTSKWIVILFLGLRDL